ncbi:UDP-N-acetylmuramate dehydrogenase, partial [Pantoea sp. Nvir]
INEQDKAWKLHVGAGENWHMLVEWTLKKGINGLENLALIPGMTGSAPVQNIGAYGMEFKDVCEYVDILNLNTGITQRLDREECAFGYRDSIFKYEPYYAIIAVGINLSKQWQPLLTYGDLARLNPVTVTAFEVFNTICYMRKSKLPETCMTGNVGSFFKNPLVSYEKAEMLKMTYPGIPSYPQVNGKVKLAAGWLIDQCQLKGLRIGGAEVYQKQALVLINVGHATSQDIIELAKTVRFHVGKKFDVWLEPEVRFIGAHGEYNTPIKAIL